MFYTFFSGRVKFFTSNSRIKIYLKFHNYDNNNMFRMFSLRFNIVCVHHRG